MFLFKRKQPEKSEQTPAEIPEERTRLGKTVAINGTITGQDDIEIGGVFEGDIDVKGEVSIRPEASIKGRVNGNRVMIGGSTEGQFSASHAMNIRTTARINGDVSTPLLLLEAGAILNGKVTMASIPTGLKRAK
jgi:cytoskeletal protein CcmA (bactofilin family)